MTSAASLAYPGARTLAGWWRQLATYQPRALWAGYLTFHRVEAPVCALHPHRLPPLEHLTLKALAVHGSAADAAAVAHTLHLPTALVARVLWNLQQSGLAVWPADGPARLAESAAAALERGEYLRPRRERRAFYFLHPDTSATPPRFVPLAHPERLAWLAAPELPFDVGELRACVNRPAEWKRQHGFPTEVTAVPDETASWENVVVAQAHRLCAALALTGDDAEPTLTAFEVNVRSWELHAAHPIFVTPAAGWPEPQAQAWLQALAEWCGQRQIPASEAMQCRMTVEGARLLVEAPEGLQERLKAAKGETWLLAGEGALRRAARLEVS
jgi:hypothetical protein